MKNRFCQACGWNLQQDDKYCFICKKCGFHLFLNPVPASGTILHDGNDRILLIKRKKQPKKGYWGLPGGFIDPEETAEEAAKREIKEEINFSVGDLKYFSSYVNRYLFQGINLYALDIVFIGKISSRAILKSSQEISQIKFFSKDEIPLNRIAFKSTKKAISDYLKNRK